jgi:transcriptional regulator
MDDPTWVAQLVDRLVAVYEAGMPQPWPGMLPIEFKTKLLQAIVGFVMPITRIEGKFKLGQNRPVEDQQGVIHHLAASADPIARALGELSQTQLEKKGT